MKKTLIIFSAGAVTTLLAVLMWFSVLHLLHMPDPSEEALHRPLEVTEVNPNWIRSGSPVFKFSEYFVSPDGRSISGIWSCDGPTTFDWHFQSDESVHVLEGAVEIDYLGNRFVLEPGHTAVFHEGTKATWHVPRHVKKSYTLHRPNRLVRSARKLSDWLDLN